MFWIGMAAGAFVCLFAIIVAISALGWQVGQERKRDGDKFKAPFKISGTVRTI